MLRLTTTWVTLKDQGKLNEAIEAYTKALSIKPNNAEAHNNMGVTLKDQGKLDEAIKAYTKALPSSLIMLRLTITWALLLRIKAS